MKVYTIFDDFGAENVRVLNEAQIDITVHPYGTPRPDNGRMKEILEEYDCVIIGTSQKITEDMFENIYTPRIIATASVGLDHIAFPKEKRGMITVINTPKANAQSVAEYTIGCALACCKRLAEGCVLYSEGKNNKSLYRKPEDLYGKTIGVIGAGNISVRIMEYALFLGMNVLCWTKHPDKHDELSQKGVVFKDLEDVIAESDVISVNLPNLQSTKRLISSEMVSRMKDTAIFISVSRLDTVDIEALFDKSRNNPGFYVCLDIDVNEKVVSELPDIPNIIVTPHIAGGTVETRKRMFSELTEKLIEQSVI